MFIQQGFFSVVFSNRSQNKVLCVLCSGISYRDIISHTSQPYKHNRSLSDFYINEKLNNPTNV